MASQPRPTKRRRRQAPRKSPDYTEYDDDIADCASDCRVVAEHAPSEGPGGASVPDHTAYKPAYAFGGATCIPVGEGNKGAPAAAASGGPQCSQYPDQFCFFCAYEKDPNAESGSAADLYGGLVDLVHSMNRQKKEFPAIVDAIRVAYERQIRPYTDDPMFGQSPEWTQASIERHLTFSNQFAPVFDASVTQVFHSIVAAQNRTLMDAVTGHVIEENRQALMSTLNNYIKWEKFQKSRSGRSK